MSKSPCSQRLSEIRDRLGSATSGPWIQREGFIETATTPSQLLGVTLDRSEGGLSSLPGQANACLIAHAPEDLWFLLNLVDQLLRENNQLKQQLSETLLQELDEQPVAIA